MTAADGIVLAGPLNVHDVNGVMKNWIGRMAHVCHRPEFAGKTALLIATTGGTSVKHALWTMEVALWTWGFRTAGTLGLVTGANMPAEEMERRYSAEILRAARRLFQDGGSRPLRGSLITTTLKSQEYCPTQEDGYSPE
jgi:multimeric flavodoxin WrbA